MVNHLNSAIAIHFKLQAHQAKVFLEMSHINKPTNESLIYPLRFELQLSCSAAVSQAGSDIRSSLWTNHYYVHDWTPRVGIPRALLSDCVSLMLCGRSGTPLPKHICHVLS